MSINKQNTHIIPVSFEYHAPTSLDEAVRLLEKYGEEARILAGGTDLFVYMKQRVEEPRHLINLRKIPGLVGIKDAGEAINIGSYTRLRTIEKSQLIKDKASLLDTAIRTIGSVQIRNMATIGGNLCNASPSADSATALLTLNAETRILGPDGVRTVPLTEFFLGPGKTVVEPSEILTEISSPYLPEDAGAVFLKVGWTSFDIATINLAVVLRLDDEKVSDCRLALGACAPTPIRLPKVEEFLQGKELSTDTVDEAANIVAGCVQPRKRWRRAPAEYRKTTAMGLTKEGLAIAAETARRKT